MKRRARGSPRSRRWRSLLRAEQRRPTSGRRRAAATNASGPSTRSASSSTSSVTGRRKVVTIKHYRICRKVAAAGSRADPPTTSPDAPGTTDAERTDAARLDARTGTERGQHHRQRPHQPVRLRAQPQDRQSRRPDRPADQQRRRRTQHGHARRSARAATPEGPIVDDASAAEQGGQRRRPRSTSKPGTYRMWCTLPDHAEKGMEADDQSRMTVCRPAGASRGVWGG